MYFTVLNKVKKYSLILFLLVSFSLTSQPVAAITTAELSAIEAAATAINPWAAALSVTGIIVSTISANAHDAMIESYFKKVLAEIQKLNRKIGLVIQNDCDIYAKRVSNSFENFKLNLELYLGKTDRSAFFNDLLTLRAQIPKVLLDLEDRSNLLAQCPKFNQYSSLVVYLLTSNIDFSIQAEYIRESLARKFNSPVAQMTAAQVLIVETDIQNALSVRLREVIRHLKLLDGTNEFGSASPFNWRDISDQRFSAQSKEQVILYERIRSAQNNWSCSEIIHTITSPETVPKCDYTGASSTIDSFSYSFDGISYAHFMNFKPWTALFKVSGRLVTLENAPRMVESWNGPPHKYLNRCYSINETLARASSTSGCDRSMRIEGDGSVIGSGYNLHLFSHKYIYGGEFSSMNEKQVYDHYSRNINLVYNRHKHSRYIKLIKTELVPILKLVQNWIDEVGNPSIVLPKFNAITDLNNYRPTINDPSYDDPSLPYTGPTGPIIKLPGGCNSTLCL